MSFILNGSYLICSYIILIGQGLNWRESGLKTWRKEAMKKKKSSARGLSRFTCFNILAIIWVTEIELRWFLTHFETKRMIYNSYMTLKFSPRVFIVKFKLLKYSFVTILFWLVISIFVIFQRPNIQMICFLWYWKSNLMTGCRACAIINTCSNKI